MDRSDFFSYIADYGKLTETSLEELKALVEEYPCFQAAHLLLARSRYQFRREEFEKHLPEAAVCCADRSRLFYLINNEKYARFFPKASSLEETDRTQTLLDAFLDSFSLDEPEEKMPEIETNIISTDYLSYLQSLEGETSPKEEDSSRPELKHQEIIDTFLEKAAANEITITSREPEPAKPSEVEKMPGGNGFLTETLATIYIKQKKYEQALAIIRQLSLNFPKKSVYFADQIRFLELLILNEKNKKE